MLRVQLLGVLLVVGLLMETASANRGPERTVELSTQVLHDIMGIPVRRIPEKLLADAQGIAIIPEVIKVGFVGGIRRGRGVVMVRDRDGDWGLPQFVILTGGSVGWQAGIQSTDVILVFRTKKSIEGLLSGKFTLGAGASVAAGPVGRSAEAATDAELKAEILSYSRGRGVFAGVAIDGSAIEIDGQSHQSFYGSPANVLPTVVPDSAMRLLTEVASLTGGREPQAIAAPIPGDPSAGGPVGTSADDLRARLASDATKLQALLDRRWQEHLALPAAVFSTDKHATADSLRAALERFDRIAADTRYRGLQQRPEFQATHDDLRQYCEAVAAQVASPLDLPPPPDDRRPTRAP
ncbi:MAG TPA: lipid-binding SYLF domain-containing protein [Pirellulales bacterium]|nr:lipid-binding SYLF domain-containing protein [Pirellulales bacterium]HWB07936.1 lipid-binding SYLF domain-containing protein [Pirellulales bacterium]